MLNLTQVDLNRRKTDRKKKRKPPWLVGGIVLLLLTVLIILQPSNLWKTLSVNSASDAILLYALSSLNFIAFVIFAFIFLRSLLKLQQERRSLQIGSKIKSRLLFYFFAISILPLIAMAIFSYLYMNRAVDRWFTQIPENVSNIARDFPKQTSRDQVLRFKQTAAMMARTIGSREVSDAELNEILNLGGLTRVEIAAPDFTSKATAQRELSQARSAELDSAMRFVRLGRIGEPELSDGKGFDIAVAYLADGKKLIAVTDMSSTENLSQIAEDSLREFDALKSRDREVRQFGLTILGLLTFLLIFASSWMALYVAKGLTRPIRALAEGADEITKGNLGYRVQVPAEDELDVLVNAFNAMSGKLEENAEELTERRRYTETVLQSLSTGVISFDGENRVTTINKAATRMLRLENTDFISFDLSKLVSPENQLILSRLIARAKRTGQAVEQTTLLRENPDGSLEKGETLPVAITATALPNENGVVIVIEDLSELIAAQRASAWREVAKRMAHEIKNPLTPIQLSAERIAKRFSLGNGASVEKAKSDVEIVTDDQKKQKVVKEGTETILREVSSLKSMVNEFSRFARLPNVKLEMGSVNDVISQSAILYKDRNSGVRIKTSLDSKLPEVMIDEEQLKRVFVNLIDNAVEAFEPSQDEKLINIKTRFDAARDLIVAEVVDNGSGIEPRDFQRLFQPYFSTKGRGTGLGLAIVQKIITEHGGKIRGVPNSTKGSKFIIELPASN